MILVPCSCGANLALSPVGSTWIMAGMAVEQRRCVACNSHGSYTRYRQLGGDAWARACGGVLVANRHGAFTRAGVVGETLDDAVGLVTEPVDDWREYASDASVEVRAGSVEVRLAVRVGDDLVGVARLLPNGIWLALPPVEA